MTTLYPTALDTATQLPTTRVDATAQVTNHASDHDTLAGAVLALEAQIGIISAPRIFTNVKAYGAVGDGSANDTIAIQAAIDSLDSTLGGTVFFPPGRYKITDDSAGGHGSPLGYCLSMPETKKGMKLLGSSGGSALNETVASNSGTTLMVSTTGAVGVVMGSYDGTGSLLQQGHFIEGLNFAEIGSSNTCTLLYVRMANRWSVKNCSFREASIGIRIHGYDSTGLARDNAWWEIIHGIFRHNNYGIKCDYAAGGNVIGGDFEPLGATDYGIWMDPYTAHVKVLGSKFDAGRMIYCQGYGNTFMVNGEYGGLTATFQPAVEFNRNSAAIGPNSGQTYSGMGNTMIGGHISSNGLGAQTGVLIGAGCEVSIVGTRFAGFTAGTDVVDNSTLSRMFIGSQIMWNDSAGNQAFRADSTGVTIGAAGTSLSVTGTAGSGTPLQKIRIIRTTCTPGAVSANSTLDFAVTGLSGVQGGSPSPDRVLFVNKATDQAGLAVVPGRITTGGSLQIKFINASSGSITPTAGDTYEIGLIGT